MRVYFSNLAEANLKDICDYLQQKWNRKVRTDFLAKLDRKIQQIATNPLSCPKSNELGGFHKCVVTKQISLFYRIELSAEEIEIIVIFDTRQNPDKLRNPK